ncbi:DNA translocase FtsK [Brevibacillus sp. IT-7CA2]
MRLNYNCRIPERHGSSEAQRKMRIGYIYGVRIVDRMEKERVVSSYSG